MKKILIGIFIGVTLCSVVTAAGVYGTKEFLKEVRIDTTRLPLVFLYWNDPVSGERGCYRLDINRLSEAPKVKWMSAFNYFHGHLNQTLGNPLLTQEEAAFCFDQAPQYAWTVSKNGAQKDRPVYSGPAWFEGGLWVEIGRVKVTTVCELHEARKTAISYHYITASNGKRGLTACEITALK